MERAPFKVLVIPYRLQARGLEYAVFRRADGVTWQFIAGGGEGGELPIQAAHREGREEACAPMDVKWLCLDSVATIPRVAIAGGAHWPANVYVVPEYCFAVDLTGHDIKLSAEHESFEWLPYEAAQRRLTWESNQNALWELRERLRWSDDGVPQRGQTDGSGATTPQGS